MTQSGHPTTGVAGRRTRLPGIAAGALRPHLDRIHLIEQCRGGRASGCDSAPKTLLRRGYLTAAASLRNPSTCLSTPVQDAAQNAPCCARIINSVIFGPM